MRLDRHTGRHFTHPVTGMITALFPSSLAVGISLCFACMVLKTRFSLVVNDYKESCCKHRVPWWLRGRVLSQRWYRAVEVLTAYCKFSIEKFEEIMKYSDFISNNCNNGH